MARRKQVLSPSVKQAMVPLKRRRTTTQSSGSPLSVEISHRSSHKTQHGKSDEKVNGDDDDHGNGDDDEVDDGRDDDARGGQEIRLQVRVYADDHGTEDMGNTVTISITTRRGNAVEQLEYPQQKPENGGGATTPQVKQVKRQLTGA